MIDPRSSIKSKTTLFCICLANTVTLVTNPTPVPMLGSQVTGKVTGIAVSVTGMVTGNLYGSSESIVY